MTFLNLFSSHIELITFAHLFGEIQNKRGGKVKLQSILMPVSEFDHLEKGDALYGKFLISLSLFA